LVVFGGAVTGLALVVAAIVVTDEPIWWWLAGVPLAAVFGALAAAWLVFRLRHHSPEERKRALDDLAARQEASSVKTGEYLNAASTGSMAPAAHCV
jgi:predicted outer membrane lipoprotein